MKILVTGATGFLGTRIVDLLREGGHDVRALVRATSDTRALAARGVELALGSLEKGEGVREAARGGVDCVIHAAGGGKVRTVAEIYASNTDTTKELLRAWDDSGAASRGARFVLVSSLAAHGPSDDGEPREPEAPNNPRSHYGKSKALAEEAVLARSADFPVTIVRPPGVYGPGDTRMRALFRIAARRGFLPMVGHGHTASWVYVDDCARAIVLGATKETPSARRYFVEDGHVYGEDELARCIGAAVGRKLKVVHLPPWVLAAVGALSEAYSHVVRRATPIHRDKMRDVVQAHWVCSAARTREELGWEPQVMLAEGTRRAAESYRAEGQL